MKEAQYRISPPHDSQPHHRQDLSGQSLAPRCSLHSLIAPSLHTGSPSSIVPTTSAQTTQCNQITLPTGQARKKVSATRRFMAPRTFVAQRDRVCSEANCAARHPDEVILLDLLSTASSSSVLQPPAALSLTHTCPRQPNPAHAPAACFPNRTTAGSLAQQDERTRARTRPRAQPLVLVRAQHRVAPLVLDGPADRRREPAPRQHRTGPDAGEIGRASCRERVS